MMKGIWPDILSQKTSAELVADECPYGRCLQDSWYPHCFIHHTFTYI